MLKRRNRIILGLYHSRLYVAKDFANSVSTTYGQAGLNAFTFSPKKWTDATNSSGIIAKSGRYDGTYAHKNAVTITENY